VETEEYLDYIPDAWTGLIKVIKRPTGSIP